MPKAAEISSEELPADAAKPSQSGKPAWEAGFERDHPELVVKAPAKKSERAAAKSALDSAVEESVEEKPAAKPAREVATPVETEEESSPAPEAEQSPADEQPADAEDKPAEEIPEDKGAAKPKLDELILKYAEECNITLEEARKDFEDNDGVLKKYAENPETFPMKLAKAYRNQQAEHTRARQHQQEANANNFAKQIIADPQGFINNALSKNRDKLLKDFRDKNPERGAILSDGAIIEELREKGMGNLQVEIQKYQKELGGKASTKRENLMSALREADKPYAAEIRQMLYKLDDQQVADPTFNFKDLVRWARGDEASVNKMVKDAEERGYKRGLNEHSRILGSPASGKPSTGAQPVKKAAKPVAGGTLSIWDKTRAEEMFSGAYATKEECWAAYDEIQKGRKRK